MTTSVRRNVLLLLVVGGLAAFLFLWERPRAERQKARAAEAARLFPVDAAAVDTLRLWRSDGSTVAARQGSDWLLLAPVQERAEEQTVQGLVNALTQASSDEIVIAEADSSVWPNFTLTPTSPGAVLVQLATSGGGRVGVWIGGDNPDESGVYVRRAGSHTIELASQSLGNLGRLTFQGLRRYQLFEVARDSVEWLKVTATAGGWSARRTPRGLWFTEETPPRQLKRYEIELLVHDLASQRIQAYVEDAVPEPRWAAYGLHAPVLDLSFAARGQPAGPRRVRIGNETEEHAWFARRDTLRSVLRLSGPLLETAARPLSRLLESNPIPDNYARLDSIAVRWLEGGTCTLVREGREFRLRPPEGWQGEAERLETPARNLARGLEELTSHGTALLAVGNGPETVAPDQRIVCRLYWPDRTVRFTLGWRSGEEHHWLYVDGERVLHRVDRDLYFRLYSVLLAVGQIPGEQVEVSAPPGEGG
jgi:hypothetical protein